MLTIFSPGRVNLIGEHTDYNNGFVLPAAIDRGLTMRANLNESTEIRLHALDKGESFSCSINDELPHTAMGWTDYVLGVFDQMWQRGVPKVGFDLTFGGNLPIGAGMSSSAALTGGTAFCINELQGCGFSRPELAQIAQAAEHTFVGIRSGILDQFASLNCIAGHAMLLDCRSLDVKQFAFPSDEIAIILCDTTIRRELVTSEYNARRAQCEAAVDILQQWYPDVHSLRDVSLDIMLTHRNDMNEQTWRRACYVVNENDRTLLAANALVQGDVITFGALMYQSHLGLQREYEVSCSELDVMTELALPMAGVLGSRMMGGGFGGCTINLVLNEYVDAFTHQMYDLYLHETGLKPNIHTCILGSGTYIID